MENKITIREAVTEKEIEQVQFDLDRFLDELWRCSMLCA